VDIGVSDCHNYISAATKLHAPVNVTQEICYRSYKRFDEEAYINDIANLPLHVAEIFDDIDDKLWCQQTLVRGVLEKHAPLKTRVIKNKQVPYMNGQLRKAINVKSMLKRRYSKYKSRQAWKQYKEQRNKVNKLKRSSIQKYFDEKCNNEQTKNGKSFWDTVKPYFTEKSGKCGQCISLLEEDKVTSDSSSVSDIFNTFFVNVAKDISEPHEIQMLSLPEMFDHYENHNSIIEIKRRSANVNFSFHPVHCDTVMKKLRALKGNKACGHDRIPASLLKCVSEELCESYTHIINSCIEQSIFPQSLKDAEVSPIFKKGDNLLKENYRPVSVLTATSKIFESIMCDQLLEFFATNLSTVLSGFRKNYCCENVLLACVESWRKALDNNECVGCVLMDLSKAFDSLPHGLLVAKLKAYGMSLDACTLVKSYLSNRRQRVKIQNVCGEWKEIERGVPQGSLAGPLLFNIFINDFIYFLEGECDLYNYADDNTLSHHDKNPNVVKHVLEKSSNIAIKWFAENNMKANPSKFQAMVLSRNNTDISFNVGDTVIIPTDCVKLLGVNIDNKLSFNQHISQLSKKAGKQINAMSRLSNVLSKENKMTVLKSFILSNFNYCPLVYHVSSKGSSLKMERLLERGIRLVLNDFSSNINSMMTKSNVSSLFCSRVRLLAVFVFKVINNMLPQIPTDLFQRKDVPYGLRKSIILVQPTYSTKTYGFNSLSYLGAKLWNLLPNECKELKSVNKFKHFIFQWDGPKCCGQCQLCFI